MRPKTENLLRKTRSLRKEEECIEHPAVDSPGDRSNLTWMDPELRPFPRLLRQLLFVCLQLPFRRLICGSSGS